MGGDLAGLLASRRFEPAPIDVDRMVRDRHQRLQTEMDRQSVDVAVLLHTPNVTYATGCPVRGVDITHALHDRPVAVVVAGEDQPILLQAGAEAPVSRVGPSLELDEGATWLQTVLADVAGGRMRGRVAVDEMTGTMLRAGLLDGATVVDGAQLVAAAKVTKTVDEVVCIAEAQRQNEAAMAATHAALGPGMTRGELAGEFLAQLHLAGAGANLIDPIFQPMPRAIADGPRTTTGHVAFPTGVDDPTLGLGDLVWVDTGIDHMGYASDYGRTWVVGRDPTGAEQQLYERWSAVMAAVLAVLGPGATAGDLCRAAAGANDGERPWLPHFYLAHGVGVESAEMPLVGTDLGPAFDDQLVLAPGMVLVLEPVIWDDGVGGYRAEEIVAVTDDGWTHLGGGHPYTPWDGS